MSPDTNLSPNTLQLIKTAHRELTKQQRLDLAAKYVRTAQLEKKAAERDRNVMPEVAAVADQRASLYMKAAELLRSDGV